MPDSNWTGASLEEALRSGKLDQPALELVGMVKAAEETGKISFTRTDCESWVDIPTDLIEKAEQVGQRPCRDHIHPVFRLKLKQPEDPEAQILAALLTSSGPSAPQVMASPQMGNWSTGGFSEAAFRGGPATSGGTIAPGVLADGIPRAIGCGQCRPQSAWDIRAGSGIITCFYMVCEKIGERTYCHLVTSEQFCVNTAGSNIWDWIRG
jgi:hypothetical protein